ncbi:hypothetical protein CTAYLR_000314 [Chrysophaeum taylorii]|uniref:Uncharacterized protein n=1 Tax=Chrysophaeum taylorii TaxID=2483200 RepID=A0AAD7UGY0_9STRA|nr:hypothetical protein CTAYLR_000314 [Chrysophaeum taylorii]
MEPMYESIDARPRRATPIALALLATAATTVVVSKHTGHSPMEFLQRGGAKNTASSSVVVHAYVDAM